MDLLRQQVLLTMTKRPIQTVFEPEHDTFTYLPIQS